MSTVIWFLPTMRKGSHTQSQIWQSFCKEEEEVARFFVIGGLCPIYRPIWPLFNIKLHHFISNQRILIRLIVIINPCNHGLAFWLWFLSFLSMSVLQSHLTRHYLGISVQIYLEITTSTLDLDMAISFGRSTCLSRSGRSSVGLHLSDLVALRSPIDLDLCDLANT